MRIRRPRNSVQATLLQQGGTVPQEKWATLTRRLGAGRSSSALTQEMEMPDGIELKRRRSIPDAGDLSLAERCMRCQAVFHHRLPAFLSTVDDLKKGQILLIDRA